MKRILLMSFSFFMSINVWAQDRVVTGKVTSTEDGSALPGVNVVLKGTTNGTVTDSQGKFQMSVPASGVLIVSFIGYKSVEVDLGGKSVFDVQLSIDVTQLGEVVITGYSTQNVREVSGSIASVKGESVGRVPIASFDQSLQGQVAGVLIQSQSGQPGAAASVLIRGKGSLNGTNQPLFILDGIEISAADFGTLNPADFENYAVLKDAASTAIYGSRGANGVIVITSKKGRGRTKVTYDSQYGFSEAPVNKLELMNSEEKLQYELDNGNPYGWTNEEVEELSQINTDWADIFFQTGKTQSHTLNFSGATDKTNFFISGSYFDQSGTVVNTGIKRYTGRINLESSVGDVFFGVNSTFGYSKFSNTSENNTGIATPLNAIRWLNPYETPYDENGEYTVITSGQPNALQELLENTNNRDQYKAIGTIFLGYNVPFVKGLTVKTTWGGDFTANERTAFTDGTTATGSGTPSQKGQLVRQFGKRFRYTGTTSLIYNTKINTDHSLTVGLFNEIVQSNSNSFFFTGFGLGGPFENEAGITPGNNTNGFIPIVGGNQTDGFNADAVDFRGGPSALLSYLPIFHTDLKINIF
jgi:TonB-dependent starch-binding outer membrane protein SusC